MVEYTYQQKIAIMRVLLDTIHADGRIDARETFYYNQLKDQLGLKDKDHEHVNEKGSLLALTQISKFNCKQKEYLSELMSRMIVVDEEIHVNEIEVYRVVCKACDIKTDFRDPTKP